MKLQPRSETFTPVEDQSWLGSATGTNDAYTATLDSTLFTALYSDGIAKSGTVVARITATGRIAPYLSGAATGQQTPIGILYTTIDVSLGNSVGAVMWHGRVIKAKLPRQSGSGSADSAVVTALTKFEFA